MTLLLRRHQARVSFPDRAGWRHVVRFEGAVWSRLRRSRRVHGRRTGCELVLRRATELHRLQMPPVGQVSLHEFLKQSDALRPPLLQQSGAAVCERLCPRAGLP